MPIAKRWFCESCDREWVRAQFFPRGQSVERQWQHGDECPMCLGPASGVVRVEFTPTFAGGDIQRAPLSFEDLEAVSLYEANFTGIPPRYTERSGAIGLTDLHADGWDE